MPGARDVVFRAPGARAGAGRRQWPGVPVSSPHRWGRPGPRSRSSPRDQHRPLVPPHRREPRWRWRSPAL